MRFSGLRVLREGLTGNRGWTPQWRDPEPQAEYDAIIIGGGGHGLSTAYYLAKNHGMTNIAVLEKGYLGGATWGAIPRSYGAITFCRAIPSSTVIR